MASDWHSIEAFTVDAAINVGADTTQRNPLGLIIRAVDRGSDDRGMGEFIYLLGVASVAIGTWVHYRADNWGTVRAVSDGFGPMAVAMGATVASQYGWFQIQGKASALFKTAFLDDGDCYLTSTDGSLDDTNAAGDYVTNALGASAVDETTLLADVEIARPNSTDLKDD